jgi:hypothetical protein
MKFIRYSKFKGFDVSGVNLGDLMEALQDSLLQSGFDDDYYWTRSAGRRIRRSMLCGRLCCRRSWTRARSMSDRSRRCCGERRQVQGVAA